MKLFKSFCSIVSITFKPPGKILIYPEGIIPAGGAKIGFEVLYKSLDGFFKSRSTKPRRYTIRPPLFSMPWYKTSQPFLVFKGGGPISMWALSKKFRRGFKKGL